MPPWPSSAECKSPFSCRRNLNFHQGLSFASMPIMSPNRTAITKTLRLWIPCGFMRCVSSRGTRTCIILHCRAQTTRFGEVVHKHALTGDSLLSPSRLFSLTGSSIMTSSSSQMVRRSPNATLYPMGQDHDPRALKHGLRVYVASFSGATNQLTHPLTGSATKGGWWTCSVP